MANEGASGRRSPVTDGNAGTGGNRNPAQRDIGTSSAVGGATATRAVALDADGRQLQRRGHWQMVRRQSLVCGAHAGGGGNSGAAGGHGGSGAPGGGG